MEVSDFSMGVLAVCYVILLITNGLSLYWWNGTINRAKASSEEWLAMVDKAQDLTSKVLQHNTDQQELLEKISGNYAELYAVVQRYLMLVHHIDWWRVKPRPSGRGRKARSPSGRGRKARSPSGRGRKARSPSGLLWAPPINQQP